MIKLRIEKVEEDPNDKPIDLLNSFSKYLKSKGIKVSDVSYDNKAVYVEDEKDINDALRILKSKFKDLYQLGGTVRNDIRAGGIDKLVPQANESLRESNDFEEYTYIKSKELYDSDGWRTEYTMYYDEVNDRYVFVLGDSDLYDPNDGYEEFDWKCDTEREANEWFDSYNGFEDDLDESICNEALRYYVTDDDYIPLSNQPNEGYTQLQAIQRAQREAEQDSKLFKISMSDAVKGYHIMDSNNNILHDLDNAI